MGKMSISIYKERDYEDFYAFGLRKNKANSKPNKPNQSLTPTEQEGFREDTGASNPRGICLASTDVRSPPIGAGGIRTPVTFR